MIIIIIIIIIIIRSVKNDESVTNICLTWFVIPIVSKHRVFLLTDNNRQQPTTTVNNRQQPDNNRQQTDNNRQEVFLRDISRLNEISMLVCP